MQLADFRREYASHGLSESELHPDPIEQFRLWMQQATAAGVTEPNAMTLATCTREGLPSARIVLLKGLDSRGFTFFTSYIGRKARELDDNPQAALVFYWTELERQVRVEGTVEKVTEQESDEYFQSRPRGSQMGALVSQQSEVLPGRDVLEARLLELEARHGEGPLPRPSFWGGYRVRPQVIEFWQGRPNRLHDRLRYRRREGSDLLSPSELGDWIVERLSP